MAQSNELTPNQYFQISDNLMEALGSDYELDKSSDHNWLIIRHITNKLLIITARIAPYREASKITFSLHCPIDHTGRSMTFGEWGFREFTSSIAISWSKDASQIVKELHRRLINPALPVLQEIGGQRDYMLNEALAKRESLMRVLKKAGLCEPANNSYESHGFMDNDIYLDVSLCGSFKIKIDYLTEGEALRVLELLESFGDREL